MSQERLLKVIMHPHLSEKSTMLADKQRQFVFKVHNSANKTAVKAAVESIFEVKVEQVRIVNVKSKTKRFRQALGRRSGWKKAYVSLQQGFDINFAGNESGL